VKEIVAIIVAVTALLSTVAAEIIVLAGNVQKPISADPDETFGGRMQTDQQRLFQCSPRDRYPRASLQSELGPTSQDWYANLAIGACLE
jgi:hypothetical protein